MKSNLRYGLVTGVLVSGLALAQAVFAGLPVLILYLIFQRHIVNAVSGRVA